MALLYGLGSPDFLSSGLSPERVMPVEPMEFSIEGAADKKESFKYRDGKLVIAGSAITKETYTMKIGIEAIKWPALELAYGQLGATTSSVNLPKNKYATIPSSAPYEIVDSDIANSTIYITDIDGKVFTDAGGTPAAGQYQYVASPSKKLVFAAADAGKQICYRVLKNYTNIRSLGAEAVYTAISSFSFSGIAYSDEDQFFIRIPKITKVGIPSLNLADVTKLEIEFQLTATGSNPLPFELYELS